VCDFVYKDEKAGAPEIFFFSRGRGHFKVTQLIVEIPGSPAKGDNLNDLKINFHLSTRCELKSI
jgi:hypothetical protein